MRQSFELQDKYPKHNPKKPFVTLLVTALKDSSDLITASLVLYSIVALVISLFWYFPALQTGATATLASFRGNFVASTVATASAVAAHAGTVGSLVFDMVNNTNSSCPTVPAVQEASFSWADPLVWAKIGGSVILLCFSAFFSGMTLGLMGLDKTTLDIVATSGSEKDRKYANRIKPIRKRGNLLLCTLLLGNVLVNTSIAILTADIVSGIVGVFVSSIMITIFGEILPQALCSRYALFIGAHTVWLVWIIMLFVLPMAGPLSLFLDCMLGKEMGTIFKREELKRLVEIHADQPSASGLAKEEARILGGVLDFSKKVVADVMTPVDRVFALELGEKLDVDVMSLIWESGHSRIPVYRRDLDHIVGLLFAKDLLLISPDDDIPLQTVLTFYGREVITVFSDTHLDEILKIFESGRSHMAIVQEVIHPDDGRDPYYKTLGIVTLEDVLEEILADEIADEMDISRKNPQSSSAFNMMRLKGKNFGAGAGGVTPASAARAAAEINLLARRARLNRLTPKQALGVANFLSKSIDFFALIPDEYVQRLVGQAAVFSVDPKDFTDEEPLVYKKGQESSYFILVLNGKIEVMTGQDNFVSDAGIWSYLGIRALRQARFVPDFDAKIVKPTRFLQITREEFIGMIRKLREEQPQACVLPEDMTWLLVAAASMTATPAPTAANSSHTTPAALEHAASPVMRHVRSHGSLTTLQVSPHSSLEEIAQHRSSRPRSPHGGVTVVLPPRDQPSTPGSPSQMMMHLSVNGHKSVSFSEQPADATFSMPMHEHEHEHVPPHLSIVIPDAVSPRAEAHLIEVLPAPKEQEQPTSPDYLNYVDPHSMKAAQATPKVKHSSKNPFKRKSSSAHHQLIDEFDDEGEEQEQEADDSLFHSDSLV